MSRKENHTMSDEKQDYGGIIIEEASQNSESEILNSGNRGARVSPKKIFVFTLLVIITMGGAVFFGFNFIKSNLTFSSGKDEKYNDTRTYSFAPDSIGKYEPDPIAPPEESEEEEEEQVPVSEDKITDTTVAPPLLIQDKQPVEESNQPTLKDRRLSAGINASEASVIEKPEKATPSRQVKLLREIDYTLIKGTKIPCILETNIVSEQDGFTSCIISQDIYSGNARILLIEKGTKVTGEYRGSVKNGDRRLQIIWDRLITPYDIVVQLDSPSTDRLGASGVTGKVDNRWRLRIGSALMVSLISDTLEIIGKRQESAEVIVESETADTSKDIAEKILEKNIDLSPIIFIREGEQITIYVADDIDLSPVYNVK